MSEEPQVTETTEATETETDWRSDFGISGDPRFEKFESPEALAKSYAEMESMMGRSVRLPTDDASPEQWEDFYKKFENVDGLMRKPDNYEAPPSDAGMYEFDTVEGFDADESVGEFKNIAHEAGLTREQANKIHGWLANNVVEDTSRITKEAEAKMATLKGQWGQAFDHKMQAAKNTAQALEKKVPGISYFFDQMAEQGYDADFIMLMDVVGEMLGESGAMKSDPRTTMTKQEAIDRIEDIRQNADHPANNEMHPKYNEARQQMIDLYKAAYG